MQRGLVWLALVDLGRAWPRPGLAALAIAPAVLAVAFFASQIELRRAEVLAGYEAAGAATFVAQLSRIADDRMDSLADSVRALDAISSVEAPYSGICAEIVADTSFLVFRNEQQQEYLGARTSVLGVDPNFRSRPRLLREFPRGKPKGARDRLGYAAAQHRRGDASAGST